MKGNSSLFARFEEIPLLQERIETGSARAKAGARRKVANLLAQSPIVENITRSMEGQRSYRETLGVTKDIRPIDDGRREAYMAELPHLIPFFALRAFSLPLDYRVPKEKPWTKEMYHHFIDAIVIQPEYLPDDFLVSLGFMNEDEKKGLSLADNISKKIELIPAIKTLLHALTPTVIGEKRTTGRMSLVADPKHPNFGGYVVFQERSEIEQDTEKKRRNMRRMIVPHFYKDHYSLIRSQRYATVGLKNKREFLSEFRDDLIPAVLVRWQRPDYTDVSKQGDIATLVAELKGSLSYHERRALEDRIKKIDFRNPEQDRQRLIGACNDIIKAINDKLGKQNEISAQTEWLRDSERQVRSAFELYYEEVMGQIPRMNEALHGVNPENMTEGANLRGEQTRELNIFLKNIERFQERVSILPEVGSPFHTLPGLIDDFLEAMSEHRRERKGAIGRIGVRHILSLVLELKKIRYEVIMKEAEYRKKVRGEGMSGREKGNLKGKIQRVRDSLEIKNFLPHIELTSAGKLKFETMIGELNNLIEELSPESE